MKSLCKYLGRAVLRKVRGSCCFPGAGVDQVVDSLVDYSSLVCIIVGGNDVHKHRSEELVGNYKEVLEKIMVKGGSADACGILPMIGHRREWLSRAIGFKRIEKYYWENIWVLSRTLPRSNTKKH